MEGTLDWLDRVFLSLEQYLTNLWRQLVFEESKHPIILALALIIVICVLLSVLCNCCMWCFGLCRPRMRQPGVIFVPTNYGTMAYPPPQQQQQQMQQMQYKQVPPQEPQPSTSGTAKAPLNV